jgi:hypothetical protein
MIGLVLARLLNTLTQALQSAGVDLSQANVAVQIDLGKRADRGSISGTSIAKVYKSGHWFLLESWLSRI